MRALMVANSFDKSA